ncbi:4Fe-4S binding protein [Sulfurisphaera javensis]|uniref:4Fe-4S binding protein n=1 Tax=Sulfurisphaera javensis TaxID=2049879 RepID=A0AAT9GN77_9CREN
MELNLLSYVVITYIVLMMAINFAILGYILRKEYINRRAVLFFTSIILYMGVESISLGYIIFYHGSLFIEPLVLFLASIPLIFSALVKSEVVRVKTSNSLSLLLSFSVVFDEIAMGYLYASAFGPHMFNPFIDAVSNIAFGIMMVADGIYFLLISRVKDIIEFSLATFAISMAFLPSIFIELPKIAEFIASLISTVIMIINIVTLYLIEIRRVTFQGQLISLSLAFFDFFMMLGLSTFASLNDMWTITISIASSMVWYFLLVLHEFPNRRIETKLRYPFVFLVLVNLAELTMGFGESVLGFNITNSLFVTSMKKMMMSNMHMMMRSPFSNPFWWLFPINPLAMGLMFIHATHNVLINSILTSYMFVMATTMSPFYVIMMGAEMSYLVYERYKHAKNLGVKRWALVILLGIPIFVILIPYYTNFYIFGMSGMIFPVTLLPFIISLLAVMIASTLFGRRAYCNTVCMSAHMWTNIFYDQFKPKKTSKIWDYTRWIFVVIMVIAFSAYIAMELKLWIPPKIGMTTLDPLNFYGMFTLNYIWWIFYFLTPVFGTYSCARQGWCGFGTFTGIFNKVLFRVKAKDVETCKVCQTKACESVCPIKIPISRDVIEKGYTNRISCVGCGDCVEACPYDNLEIIDITSYLHRKKVNI